MKVKDAMHKGVDWVTLRLTQQLKQKIIRPSASGRWVAVYRRLNGEWFSRARCAAPMVSLSATKVRPTVAFAAPDFRGL